MIFDFRFSNFDLRLRSRRSCFACRDGYRRKLICFLKKWIDPSRFQQFRGNDQFQPETGLVRFLFDYAGLVNKVGSGFGSTQSPVVGPDRGTPPNNLVSDCISAACPWKSVSKCEDSQGELFRAFFHFKFIHDRS